MLVLAAALSLVLQAPDLSSPEMGLIGNTATLCMFVSDEKIHKELVLDEKQVRELAVLVATTRDRMKATSESVSAETSRKARRDAPEIEKTFTKETGKAIAEVLTPKQLARLKQISLQAGTVSAFLDPSVKAALKLDEEQVRDLQAIHDEARRTIQREVRAGKLRRGEIQKRALVLREEGRAKALARLTADQKAIWDGLLGAPYFPDQK